jgi:hypothetical protein
VGGGATTTISGEAAVRYLAINALAQAYEQQFELGIEEEEEENDHSDDGNSETTDNRKPAAEDSSEATDNQKQAANDSSEATDNQKPAAEDRQWMVHQGKSSMCCVALRFEDSNARTNLRGGFFVDEVTLMAR